MKSGSSSPIFDAPFRFLEEGNLLSISFENIPSTAGTAPVEFSGNPGISLVDVDLNLINLDEISNGSITILP